MSSRLSDPQRLVELVADEMFRELSRSRNGHRRAGEVPSPSSMRRDGSAAADDPAASAAASSPCDPPD
jgi:hypothetical protein